MEIFVADFYLISVVAEWLDFGGFGEEMDGNVRFAGLVEIEAMTGCYILRTDQWRNDLFWFDKDSFANQLI